MGVRIFLKTASKTDVTHILSQIEFGERSDEPWQRKLRGTSF